MTGFSGNLCTKQDYINAVSYAETTGEGAEILTAELRRIKASATMMILREAARNKPADRQHQEDYEPAPDPGCEMKRLNLTEEEIDRLIERMEKCLN